MRRRYLLLALLLVTLSKGFSKPGPGLRFIENKNQWPKQVFFTSNLRGGTVFLLQDRFRFRFMKQPVGPGRGPHHDRSVVKKFEDGSQQTDNTLATHTFDVQFLNANAAGAINGHKQLQTVYNYFTGNDPSRWSRRVKSFSEVRYQNVYNGIDLSVYSEQDNMKYEWIVAPQADAGLIQLKYTGADMIDLANGNIHIKTSVNEIWEYKPYAYQWVDGMKNEIACEYQLINNVVTYLFPEGYDDCRALVIDPILIFSGYSGSTLDNWGNTATYDSHGNTFSGGIVNNPDKKLGFPITTGAYQMQSAGGDWDIGILKYDSSGANILYATYLGGNGTETPQSLVVDSQDQLLVLGATSSTDFPVTNGTTFQGGQTIDPIGGVDYTGGTDIFIAKLSEDGDAYLGGTYLGGSSNDGVNFVQGDIDTENKTESPLARNYGDQLRGDIIVDNNDTIYIASNTRSSDFASTTNSYGGGFHDGIIVKLLPDLSAVNWAKFIGGSKSDVAYSIKLTSDSIYIAGGTTSANFPGVDGLHSSLQGDIDGWIASLSKKTGLIGHATYLGTEQYDQTYFIDLNSNGEIYAFGQTKGKYPVFNSGYVNAFAGQFIHKLSSDLKSTVFSTTIGSEGTADSINPNISPTAFLVNECNNIFISGWGGDDNVPEYVIKEGTVPANYVGGNTKDMPISGDAYQKTTEGSDFYLAVLSSDASSFLFGTYLGGNKSATHVDGGTSRFDKKGIVYHAVCAGCGGSSDFPAVNVPASRSANKSSNCNNAVFKYDLSTLRANIVTNSIDHSLPGITKICLPDPVVLENKSVGGVTYEWTIADTTINKNDNSEIVYHFKTPGTYDVTLKAVDQNTCAKEDVTTLKVYVFERQTEIQDDATLCAGTPYDLKANGDAFFDWTTKDGSFEAHDRNTSHTVNPSDTTMYYVKITEDGGCIRQDSVRLNVIPAADVNFKISKHHDCFSRPEVEVTNLTKMNESDQAIFDFGDGETSDADRITHTYASDATYHVKLTIAREFCVYDKTSDVNVYLVKSPNVITPAEKDGDNDFFSIQYSDTPGKTPADFDLNVSVLVYNRWGKLIYQSNDYHNDWAGEGLAAGIYYYELKIANETVCKDFIHIIK